MDAIAHYPSGAVEAQRLGEGRPEHWEKIGIVPLSSQWTDRLGILERLAVGGYNVDERPPSRVIGGVCIYKSGGSFRELPLSFLWELLVVYMFAKQLRVNGLVLVPIAEEIHNYPNRKDAYLRLSEDIKILVKKLNTFFNINVCVDCSKQLGRGGVKRRELYGLFHPFTSDLLLRLYPLGDPKEEEILKVYESYAVRYSTAAVKPTDLIVDGIHLSRSVIVGIGNSASYIPTLPLRSLDRHETTLLVDSRYNPSLFTPDIDLGGVVDYLEVFEKVMDVKFMDLLKFVQDLGCCTAAE